jgi:DtxR family transcriptional regulator, Mn-dependent transcriptional regulator
MLAEVKYSPAIEDYVKAIYQLQQHQEQVSTTLLATYLHFSPASVTGMLQRLARLELVTYKPYHGVALTALGERAALEVLRHHRLLETFLVETLHYSWDEVHDEAEVLEHAISERLEARIAECLGHPSVDPHGDPIPTSDLILSGDRGKTLYDLPIGVAAQVVRILNQDPAHLRYLRDLGLVRDATVVVQSRAPFDGPLMMAVDCHMHMLDSRLARAILVRLPTNGTSNELE